jgi:hypothetical protein
MITTTTTDSPATSSHEPTRRRVPPIVPLVGDEPAVREWAAELVARARADGVELTGDDRLVDRRRRPPAAGAASATDERTSWASDQPVVGEGGLELRFEGCTGVRSGPLHVL